MIRAPRAQYAYRPELLERPSMARFVLLSLLLHTWMVLLFGDTTGGRRDGSGWSRSFFATLERSVVPPPRVGQRSGVRDAPRASEVGQTPQPVAAETEQTDAAPPPSSGIPATPPLANEVVKPIEFEKIPAIAVEVKDAVTPFAVAPIAVDPLAAPTSTVAPVFSPITPVGDSGAPKVSSEVAGFAVYVPPIIERAAVKTGAVPMPAIPILPKLAAPRAEREIQPEFQSYIPPPVATPVPPPIVPAVASTPAVAQERAPVATPTAPPVTPAVTSAPAPAAVVQPIAPLPVVAPPMPVVPIATTAPIAPISPLTISPATKTVESYRPREIESSPSAATPQNREPSRIPQPMPDNAAAAAAAAAATAAPSAIKPTLSVPASGAGPSAIFNLPLPPIPTPTPTPSPPAQAAPRSAPTLDLDALRRQARDVGREGTGRTTLMPFPTVAKETPKKDMEKIFDKALKRPDCKDAYADLGLAAVVPLARDAAKDGGCKW